MGRRVSLRQFSRRLIFLFLIQEQLLWGNKRIRIESPSVQQLGFRYDTPTDDISEVSWFLHTKVYYNNYFHACDERQCTLALLLSPLVLVVPLESRNHAAVTKGIHLRNMFFHISKERAKAWEKMRSFFSVGIFLLCNILSFFRLLSEFKEMVDIIYYYSLYFGWTRS